jgi:hypothetical protein
VLRGRYHWGLDGPYDDGKIPAYACGAAGQTHGIVSIGDVVKSRVEEIDHETKALRDYIQTA